MNEIFKYLDYCGSIEANVKDGCLHGRILHIRDTISYEGQDLKELRKAFENSVDDYLDTCKVVGREPQKSFSGSFNVRVGPELHRSAALEAVRLGINLNELVKKAVIQLVDPFLPKQVTNIYYHSQPRSVSYSSETREETTKWQTENIQLRHL